MKPPAAILEKGEVPVYVARFELRDRGMPAVRAAYRRPQSKSSLGKIQSISGLSSYSIVRNPLGAGLVDTSLIDQVLDEPANGVINQCCDYRGIQPKAPFETTCNIVFAAAFPHPKFPRMRNPGFSGIKTKHHFSQGNQVPTALRS